MFQIAIIQQAEKDSGQLAAILQQDEHIAVQLVSEEETGLLTGDIDLIIIDFDRLTQVSLSEHVAVVVTASDKKWAYDAFRLGAVGYLLKPYRQEEVWQTVGCLRDLLRPKQQVYIKTFGRFDVFINGMKLYFRNAKAKELLALLVDRQGGTVTMAEAIDVLWEGRSYDEAVKQLYRKAVRYIKDLLAEYHLDFFVVNRGSCSVIPNAFVCDFYQLLADEPQALRNFDGEYMIDYSWSEMRVAWIGRHLGKRYLNEH